MVFRRDLRRPASSARHVARPLLWKTGDEGIDRPLRPDGAAAAVVAGTSVTARIQTGYLYTYALVMLLGVAAAITWAMAR
jgi:NADH-quinone oxidoreductase subunit L